MYYVRVLRMCTTYVHYVVASFHQKHKTLIKSDLRLMQDIADAFWEFARTLSHLHVASVHQRCLSDLLHNGPLLWTLQIEPRFRNQRIPSKSLKAI